MKASEIIEQLDVYIGNFGDKEIIAHDMEEGNNYDFYQLLPDGTFLLDIK